MLLIRGPRVVAHIIYHYHLKKGGLAYLLRNKSSDFLAKVHKLLNVFVDDLVEVFN